MTENESKRHFDSKPNGIPSSTQNGQPSHVLPHVNAAARNLRNGGVFRDLIVVALSLSVGFSAPKKPIAQPPTDLPSRYLRMSCAVVQITTDGGAGTGFFISPDGDVITAAHVALDRKFSEPKPGQIQIDVDYKPAR